VNGLTVIGAVDERISATLPDGQRRSRNDRSDGDSDSNRNAFHLNSSSSASSSAWQAAAIIERSARCAQAESSDSGQKHASYSFGIGCSFYCKVICIV
jgi:hypothetical protein